MIRRMSSTVSPSRRRARTAAVLVSSIALAAGACAPDDGPAGKVELVAAPAEGAVAPWVFDQLQAARARGRDVLVYVGASWCEPCQHFHQAAARGDLDAWFPRLTLLEFDQDRDEARLARAGYTSEYIPLFVRPRPDGSAGSARMQGSVKGTGALIDLTPRLHRLLGQ